MQSYQKYKLRKEMEQMEKEDKWRFIHGISEFMGVVLGIVLIFVLLALLFSLLSFLKEDFTSTFSILLQNFSG